MCSFIASLVKPIQADRVKISFFRNAILQRIKRNSKYLHED